ncbi:F-box only protein 31 [Frankliniella fusca]|uniref:F-box only protein 31 n=1 Tax=Frankliniella fusca TaxID=407009 RepID=A0AAE1HAT1_9NEOP|nr:F-box only protein 31 [Frankliniella fusca]
MPAPLMQAAELERRRAPRRSRRIRRMPPKYLPLEAEHRRRHAAHAAAAESPIDLLPTELLIQVFQHVDMQTLVSVSQVCRRFRDAVLAGSVWRGRSLSWEQPGTGGARTVLGVLRLAPCLDELNLRFGRCCTGRSLLGGRLRALRALKLSDTELCTCNIARVLERFGACLQHLDLQVKMTHMSEDKVLELWESVHQMKQLRSLRLAGYLPCRLTYSFPARALQDQTLLAVDLHDFEADHYVTMLSLVSAHHATIRKLTLPDTLSEDEVRRVLDQLRVVEDIDMVIGGHIAHLNGLPIRRLTLRHKNEASSSRFLEHVGECTALAGVQELCLSWSEGDLRDPVLSSLAAMCADLAVLRLHNMCDDKAPGLIDTVKEFTQIHELHLNKFYPMDVQFIDELAMGALPLLRRLTLRDVLIGVPHASAALCARSPCYDHHFERLAAHRHNLVFIFHDYPECWHRKTTIEYSLSCYCDACMTFYAHMTLNYNEGVAPVFWKAEQGAEDD